MSSVSLSSGPIHLGLDTSKNAIAVGILRPDEVSPGAEKIFNDEASVRRLIDRFGDRFLHRIFTEGEIAYCARRRVPAIHFAGRFAAKEAAMKALGTGRSRVVLWRDVEVVRVSGPPQLQLHGGAARRFAAIGGVSSRLSITHSDQLAMAQYILLEASLSFLGLGINQNIPSWGNLLSTGPQYYLTQPWLMLWPGLAILFTTLAFNLLGDGLRDAFDPRSAR